MLPGSTPSSDAACIAQSHACITATKLLHRVLSRGATCNRPVSVQVRTLIRDTSLEVWAVGQQAAYRLHLPRLYSRILPDRSILKVNSQRQKVYLLLHKVSDAPWPFIKA